MTLWPQRRATVSNWFYVFLLLYLAVHLTEEHFEDLSLMLGGVIVLWVIWSALTWLASRLDRMKE